MKLGPEHGTAWVIGLLLAADFSLRILPAGNRGTDPPPPLTPAPASLQRPQPEPEAARLVPLLGDATPPEPEPAAEASSPPSEERDEPVQVVTQEHRERGFVFRLQAVFIRGERALGLILYRQEGGGQRSGIDAVREGEDFLDYRVESVALDRIVLRRDQDVVTLILFKDPKNA